MSTQSSTVIICNRKGLHARAAAEVVNVAVSFKANATIAVGDQTAKCTSLIQLLTLAASKGTTVKVEAEGEEAKQLVDALCELINNKFNEDE